MLQLTDISKNYEAGTITVEALKDINLIFRDNEFVSVLGPSGCGKTTLLNLLGGLDRYTTGDLIINGKSTKDFTDGDWDTYCNRRVGFVFQNYNLIPHQTVLRNVELALTLSGVHKAERRRRATEVLDKVGLSDQLHKKPNQMSGGQMQRVSIARALVNNPEILLADEPTGALDSETSTQILELIKEIAQDRLVIMVTHNKKLAEQYSTRIIKLFDGNLVDDSNNYDIPHERVDIKKKRKDKRGRKPSMSFLTALSLSANNLLTKKTRTFLTAFAGSIGIIGIALILSLSNGAQLYIDRVQEETLSTYPITIESNVADMAAIMSAMRDLQAEPEHEDPDMVYSHDIMSGMLGAMSVGREENDLAAFMSHLSGNREYVDTLTNAVMYTYDINLNIFSADYSEDIMQINPVNLLRGLGGGLGPMGGMMRQGFNIWTEMLNNPALLASQYDVLQGRWPQSKNEIVLIVDEHNQITDFALYALGLKDRSEIGEMMRAMQQGEEFATEAVHFTYDELMDNRFKLVPGTDMYQEIGGEWVDMSDDREFMEDVLRNALDIDIVGIIRPSDDAVMTAISGTVGYLHTLTEHVATHVNASEIVRQQKENPDIDVFSGKPFADPDAEPEEVDIATLPPEVQAYLATLNPAEQREVLAQYATTSTATYDGNMGMLGVVDINSPDTISIYPKDFAAKEAFEDFIREYNRANEDNAIRYTDLVGLMMNSVSSIIDIISSVLIAFVGISLVVSSIMIGIITYVSVLERTREIGILKSIGASKRDISRVFNAETMIVGFTAGTLGIAITFLINIPANMIIHAVTGASNIAALPLIGAAVLVVLSMALTLIAGLIPSKIAAKKDPVVALRTE